MKALFKIPKDEVVAAEKKRKREKTPRRASVGKPQNSDKD